MDFKFKHSFPRKNNQKHDYAHVPGIFAHNKMFHTEENHDSCRAANKAHKKAMIFELFC